MTAGDMFFIRGGLQPSRKAIWCKGGDTDDYIEINAAGAARVAANDTVGAFMAWINIPDITGTYCIVGAGDASVVEFLEFNVEAGLLTARCTDATVVQFVTQEDAIGLTPHRWHHVAMVQSADGAGCRLYIDGVLRASTNDTATDVNEWFNNLDLIDTMRIGAANKAGDNSVTNEFKGGISDVRIYSANKTRDQVKLIYEGTNDTTGLTGHYQFNDNYLDSGSDAANGTLTGTSVNLVNNYSEFTSRYNYITTPVVADTCLFSVSDEVGYLLVIKAA